MREYLEAEWLNNLEFMQRHIEFEEANVAKSKQYKMVDLPDLQYY